MTVQPTDVGGTIQHHNVGGSSANGKDQAMSTFCKFRRVDKRTFDRAFSAGRRVAMSRDWSADATPVSRGFTRETVADPYCDTGRGGTLRYWVEIPGTATPVGPVEWNSYGHEGEPWAFYCAECGMYVRYHSRLDAVDARESHALRAEVGR